ncbi:lipid phosphate phosphatase epsilon [Salix suchowensis]|nr:lipid phosphate phosphatase epsilon [Salix suchowensis]
MFYVLCTVISPRDLFFHPLNSHDSVVQLLLEQSKWLVVTVFSAIILWRHDAKAMWAASGSVVNSILSVILKRILNQERPDSASRSDPGMPSSYGQSIFFTVVFAILSVGEWLSVNEFTLIISASILAFGTYLGSITWLRVSRGLHTINQVVAGVAVGSIFSILRFWSWEALVLNAFISSLWVRMVVVMGAAVFCLAFLVHVIGYCFKDE